MMDGRLLIGAGAGFAGDRFDAAVAVARDLTRCTGPRYLVFETLAERTLALSQDPVAYQARQRMMLRRLEGVLPLCLEAGVGIIGNFGSQDPAGTARQIVELCDRLGCRRPRVAVVVGDDLLATHTSDQILAWPLDQALEADHTLLSANVYLGAFPIAQALAAGAEIVITGRVADPALALGPMIHTFGLGEQDWDALACGTLAGHLVECGAQISGGYFADPGFKEVPGLAWVGYPIIEISAQLDCLVRKPEGSGGRIDAHTVTEQLLYEIHDPARYLTPDVILDVSGVEVTDLGDDRVRVRGARGVPRPDTLKATLCFDAGWFGEAEISYAGPNAAARGRLAMAVLRERCEALWPGQPVRLDLIGVLSVFSDSEDLAWGKLEVASDGTPAAADVRVRMATHHPDRERVEQILGELEALYTAGPAAGGGVRSQIQRRISTLSATVARDQVSTRIRFPLEERP